MKTLEGESYKVVRNGVIEFIAEDEEDALDWIKFYPDASFSAECIASPLTKKDVDSINKDYLRRLDLQHG